MAFATTAGRTLLIGVEDRSGHVRGGAEPLDLEEQMANLIADHVVPRLVPELEILPWRRTQVLAVKVHPSPVRPPYLRLVTVYQGCEVPTVGGILLFGRDRERHFPDAWIQAGRFRGTDRSRILDRAETRSHPVRAVEEAIAFVQKHGLHGTEIGAVRRRERGGSPARRLEAPQSRHPPGLRGDRDALSGHPLHRARGATSARRDRPGHLRGPGGRQGIANERDRNGTAES